MLIATFVQSTMTQTFKKNKTKPCHVVFIGKLSLSTLRKIPKCQGFSHFSGFLHHFVLAKLATSSIRVDVLKPLILSQSPHMIKGIYPADLFTSCYCQIRLFYADRWIPISGLTRLLYKCAVLWRAACRASATERFIRTIRKENGSSVDDLFAFFDVSC